MNLFKSSRKAASSGKADPTPQKIVITKERTSKRNDKSMLKLSEAEASRYNDPSFNNDNNTDAPTVMMMASCRSTDTAFPTIITTTSESDLNACADSNVNANALEDDMTLGDEDFSDDWKVTPASDTADDDDSIISSWTSEDKYSVMKSADDACKRLDRVLFEVKKQLYHRNLFLQLRFRSDCPEAAVKIIKEILQLEAQRDRNVNAIAELQSLLIQVRQTETIDTDSEDEGADVNYVMSKAVKIPNFAQRVKDILKKSAPSHGLVTSEELFDEAKARLGAVSLLTECGDCTLTEL